MDTTLDILPSPFEGQSSVSQDDYYDSCTLRIPSMPVASKHKRSRLAKLINFAFYACLILCSAVAILHHLRLFTVDTVLTGSMRPGIQPGDMVIATPTSTSSLRVGQIILYEPPGYKAPISHRLVFVHQTASGVIIQTKGDANNIPEQKVKLVGKTAWVVDGVIPHFGYVAMLFKEKNARLLFLLIVGFMIITIGLSAIWSKGNNAD